MLNFQVQAVTRGRTGHFIVKNATNTEKYVTSQCASTSEKKKLLSSYYRLNFNAQLYYAAISNTIRNRTETGSILSTRVLAGYSLLFLMFCTHKWIQRMDFDAWPGRRQTNGYLPSRKAAPLPLVQYSFPIGMAGVQRVWACQRGPYAHRGQHSIVVALRYGRNIPAGVPVLLLVDEVAEVLVERLGARLCRSDVWQIAVDQRLPVYTTHTAGMWRFGLCLLCTGQSLYHWQVGIFFSWQLPLPSDCRILVLQPAGMIHCTCEWQVNHLCDRSLIRATRPHLSAIQIQYITIQLHTKLPLLGPFYGTIAVPSVTRCRCCCCCGMWTSILHCHSPGVATVERRLR